MSPIDTWIYFVAQPFRHVRVSSLLGLTLLSQRWSLNHIFGSLNVVALQSSQTSTSLSLKSLAVSPA